MSLWAIEESKVELRPNATEDDLQLVVRAIYRQILGNEHLMDCDRLTNAESQLRNRDITVRQFVSTLAKSDLYRSLFFETSSQYRFIELNFKHFLGRPPLNQAEISEHVQLYNNKGYDAEIDAYVESEEYLLNFGENVVPYARATSSQLGISNVGFNNMFTLLRGSASSDGDGRAKLITALAANLSAPIKSPAPGSSSNSGNTAKRFRIEVATPGAGPRFRTSKVEYVVNYSQMSKQVQSIHKSGGKILKIAEVI